MRDERLSRLLKFLFLLFSIIVAVYVVSKMSG